MDSTKLVPEFKCKKCDKKYYREGSYKKHMLLCSGGNHDTPLLDSIVNIGLDNRLLKTDGALVGHPLQSIVIELVKSNSKLRKDIEELKRWTQTKKKKINILEWLNENSEKQISTILNYKEYISNLIITRKELEIVFNSDLINGTQTILETYIETTQSEETQSETIPFKSFDQKNNTIYVFTENGKWELLSWEDFNKMIFKISKKLLTEFGKWKEENEHQLYTDEFSSIFIQNTKKVIGGDMPLEKLQNKIHLNLYKYLKKNLQNIIEYEFS